MTEKGDGGDGRGTGVAEKRERPPPVQRAAGARRWASAQAALGLSAISRARVATRSWRAGAVGFSAFVYFLHQKNADQRLVDEIRLKTAREESTEQLWAEAERRMRNEAEARAAAGRDAP